MLYSDAVLSSCLEALWARRMKGRVHLLAAKDEPLLGRRDALLLLDALFDPQDLVSGLNINLDLAPNISRNAAAL